MTDPAVDLFEAIYQNTDGSIEAAVLELKRVGWGQTKTVSVIEQVFGVTKAYAEYLVASSVAWE